MRKLQRVGEGGRELPQRILLGLILSFVAGVLSVLVFQHVLPLLLRSVSRPENRRL